MTYSPISQKNYNEKCERITLKYTEKELKDYNRLIKYITDNNMQKSVYIKNLIKSDLDAKGIPYPTDPDDGANKE